MEWRELATMLTRGHTNIETAMVGHTRVHQGRGLGIYNQVCPSSIPFQLSSEVTRLIESAVGSPRETNAVEEDQSKTSTLSSKRVRAQTTLEDESRNRFAIFTPFKTLVQLTFPYFLTIC